MRVVKKQTGVSIAVSQVSFLLGKFGIIFGMEPCTLPPFSTPMFFARDS
jgi:hypothetical protein